MENSNHPSVGDSTACHENENKEQLQMEINSLECPFTWLPDRSSFAHVQSEYIIKESLHNDGNSSLSKYVKFMRLIYELEHTGSNEVREKMEEWKRFFAQVSEEPFFEKYYQALKHILYSSEAVLLFKTGKYSEVYELLQKIKQIPVGDSVSRAGFKGLKAKFFNKYGFEGHKIGLPLAREALSLCENEPQWIYMIAKSLRDIRRAELYSREKENGSVEDELKLFEKLITLDNKPIYFIRCGTTYHDFASHLSEMHKRNKEHKKIFDPYDCCQCKTIGDYCNKGVDYLRKSIAAETPTKMKTYLNLIIALNNIPRYMINRYRNIGEEWAKKVEGHLTDTSDDRNNWFSLGKYYQNVKWDKQRAEKCFIKAADLGSVNGKKEVIIMNYEKNPYYNPCKDIKERIEMYPDRLKKIDGLCQITSYYLLIKRDVLQAVETFKQVIAEDPELKSNVIQKHKSWFRKMSTTNLLTILLDDVSKCLESKNEGTEAQKTLSDFKKTVQEIQNRD